MKASHRIMLAAAFVAAGASATAAGRHQHPPSADAAPAASQAPSPYAGMQARPLKALSEQQVDDLRAGRGMSLALAAELNGYPGPVHALELARELGLTEAQQAAARQLFDTMRHEAVAIGLQVLAAETELDALFRERLATSAAIEDAGVRAAAAMGRLRTAHLRHHVAMTDVLTPGQVERYARLRGYR